MAARKLFLKHKGGTKKLEKNKENTGKQQTNLLKRVSFECQNHFAQPAHYDTKKLAGKHPQLKRQIRSPPTVLLMDDKNTSCIASKDIKCQFYSLEQRPEKREGRSDIGDNDGEETVNKKEPDARSQINCTDYPQECHKQINEIEAKENAKIDMLCPRSQDDLDGDNRRSIDTTVTMWHKENLVDSGSQVTGWATEASPNTSEIQNLEENQTDLVNQNSGLQIAQAVNDRSSAIKAESCPGFKKVNDHIVKVTSKPNREQAATTTNSQRKQHQSAGDTGKLRSSPSSDSVFTSSDSEDEPKPYCSQYPVKPSTDRTTHTDHNLDLSDGDYATDEPSELEDGKYPAKKFEVQELAGQQEVSFTTSSSGESRTGAGSVKGRKTCSPLRKSPFHLSKTAKDGREPETWRKGNASHSTECCLQPLSLTRDLVASLFPAFKTKTSVEDERAAVGEANYINGEIFFYIFIHSTSSK